MRGLLIAVVLVLTGLTFYSAMRFKSADIEEDITNRVTAAVASEGAGDGIGVDVNGRHVTLSGLVSSEAEEDTYLDAADDTFGALGPIDGLTQNPGGYLTAVKSEDGLSLYGSVPDEAARAALLDTAASATDGTVTDGLRIGGVAADWRDEARFGLGQMATLGSGTLTATANTLSLSGTAPGDVSGLAASFADRGGWTTNITSSDTAADLAALAEDVAVRDANILRLQEELDATTAEGAETQQESALSTLRMAQNEARLEALEAVIAERDESIAGLEASLAQTAEDNASVVEGLEGTIAGLTGELAGKDQQIETLEARLQDAGGTSADLTAALADISQRDGTIAERDGTIAELSAALAERDGSIEGLNARIAELGATDTDAANGEAVAALEGQISTLTATIATLESRPSFAAQVAQQCDRQAAAVLEGARINFASATADIEDESVPLLERLTGIALACVGDGLTVEIGGHTDSQGSDEGNQRLSEARAAAVVAFMTDRGVPTDGLNAVGYGETTPIADNETEEGRAANRRISFEWQAQ